ncbi:MAG: Sapep family Mn(2+)-dependent dipeptidase [Oscillospiraceae bacterium]|nr:Sapep family Mn(2+)-dependent dipeptidase [Oscillospiraceae bacterium]
MITAELEKMLDVLGRLVSRDSVRTAPEEGKPFGPGPAAALEEALAIAGEMGFRTRNMENYCGWAEIGQGEEIIGIAAHLDVVPPGEGWDTDPFTMVHRGGRVYGRGVSDDKGGVTASLFAMKRLAESGRPLNKRVRLLLGTAEETGSECMEYYAAHGEPVSCGFTPDGSFPGIHGEKGGTSMTAFSKHTAIISMNGGFVTNAVCSRCVTEIPSGAVDEGALRTALARTELAGSTVTEQDGILRIDARGTAAHASMPLAGVNAAGCTMRALADAGMKDDFVDFYNERIGTSCDGSGIGLKMADDWGELTLNNGIVKTEDGVISCTLDLRTPVTVTEEQIRAACAPFLEDDRGRIEIGAIGKPLFYPADSPLVQCLYRAYVEVTGDTENKPMVIGGGTYAKHVPGIIAFGCGFPGVDNHIHDANEFLDIDELERQTEIYVRAIENLLDI